MSRGDSNMSLEDILHELSKYGRPHMNQFSASASPGFRVAGTWGCEVGIQAISYEEAGRPSWYYQPCIGAPKGWNSAGSTRCIGRGKTPTEAAAMALRSRQRRRRRKSPSSPWFISATRAW